jgi:hypothetical protein
MTSQRSRAIRRLPPPANYANTGVFATIEPDKLATAPLVLATRVEKRLTGLWLSLLKTLGTFSTLSFKVFSGFFK